MFIVGAVLPENYLTLIYKAFSVFVMSVFVVILVV